MTMDDQSCHKSKCCKYMGIAVVAILLACGPAIAGYFIGSAIKSLKLADREVSVKGLAEREVKSDLAVWQIKFVATGANLSDVNAKISGDTKKVESFLEAQGFAKEEVELGQIQLVDTMANEYSNNYRPDSRYIITSSVTLKSPKVDEVQQTSVKLADLITSGVTLASGNQGPVYSFTKFAEVKSEMIAEATKAARSAAEQFAKDSNSRVGAIKRANQGVVSITGRYDFGDADSYNNSENSIYKKLRVVATVVYFLE